MRRELTQIELSEGSGRTVCSTLPASGTQWNRTTDLGARSTMLRAAPTGASCRVAARTRIQVLRGSSGLTWWSFGLRHLRRIDDFSCEAQRLFSAESLPRCSTYSRPEIPVTVTKRGPAVFVWQWPLFLTGRHGTQATPTPIEVSCEAASWAAMPVEPAPDSGCALRSRPATRKSAF